MIDFLLKLISIPIFIVFIWTYACAVFGKVRYNRIELPILSKGSILMRLAISVFGAICLIISVKLWG
jgi:hypothetical protein